MKTKINFTYFVKNIFNSANILDKNIIASSPSRFVFVPTGHIFEKSVNDIKKAVEREHPTIIAVELDNERYNYLIEKFKNPRASRHFDLSFIGLLNWLLASLQKSISFELEPGSDMMEAIQQAQRHKLSLRLIDRPIYITMNHFISIPWKEKINLFFPKKIKAPAINSDILNNPQQLEEIISLFKKETPSLYRTFVEERDFFLAFQLFQIFQQNPTNQRILVVVGAGHLISEKSYLDKLMSNQISAQEIQQKMRAATEIRRSGILSTLSLIPLFVVLFILLVLIKLRIVKIK